MPENPLILTGFMSAGKTSVAALLGELLQCKAIDLDEVVLATEGRSAKDLILTQGEAAFREVETRVLAQVFSDNQAKVIALGGGTWIVDTNRRLIAANNGISIWLDAAFSLCWERIPAGGGERPLATTESDALLLYEKRQPYYALANFRVEITAKKTIDEIAQEIVSLVLKT